MWITQPIDNKDDSTCLLGEVMQLGEERHAQRGSNGPVMKRVGQCG